MQADLNLEQGWPEVIAGAIVESAGSVNSSGGAVLWSQERPRSWPDPFVRVYWPDPSSLLSNIGVYKVTTSEPGNLQLIRYDPSEHEESQSIEWMPGMGPHPGSLY
jgi:hypothetical protein